VYLRRRLENTKEEVPHFILKFGTLNFSARSKNLEKFVKAQRRHINSEESYKFNKSQEPFIALCAPCLSLLRPFS